MTDDYYQAYKTLEHLENDYFYTQKRQSMITIRPELGDIEHKQKIERLYL